MSFFRATHTRLKEASRKRLQWLARQSGDADARAELDRIRRRHALDDIYRVTVGRHTNYGPEFDGDASASTPYQVISIMTGHVDPPYEGGYVENGTSIYVLMTRAPSIFATIVRRDGQPFSSREVTSFSDALDLNLERVARMEESRLFAEASDEERLRHLAAMGDEEAERQLRKRYERGNMALRTGRETLIAIAYQGSLYGASRDYQRAKFRSYWGSVLNEMDGWGMFWLENVPSDLADNFEAQGIRGGQVYSDGYEAWAAARPYVTSLDEHDFEYTEEAILSMHGVSHLAEDYE